MDIITSRPIYSNATGSTVNLQVLAQEMGNMERSKLEAILKTLNRAQTQELKRLEQQRIKQEKLSDRASLKAQKKADKTSFVQKIQEKRATKRASRNAKKLLKLKDKSGKEKVLYPLTRLKRKNNQIVRVEPDRTETVIQPNSVVTLKDGSMYDKMEIKKVTSIPLQNITPELVQSSIINVPATQAEEQAKDTFTPIDENIPMLGVDPSKITTDDKGDAYAGSDITFDSTSQSSEETDDSDNSDKPKSKTWMYVGIGVGVLAIGGLITYLVVSNKSNK